jgi:hypothetical protein
VSARLSYKPPAQRRVGMTCGDDDRGGLLQTL